jgi:hypothetical protein
LSFFDRRPSFNQPPPKRPVSLWYSLFLIVPLLAIVGTIIFVSMDSSDDDRDGQTPEAAFDAASDDGSNGESTTAVADDGDAASAGVTPAGNVDVLAFKPASIAGSAFGANWARTDFPVASGSVERTWMWGPEPISPPLIERYDDAPDGVRVVQYFDKARMEVTDPDADSDEAWSVSSGLLVREMVTGELQLGASEYEEHEPSEINLVGDPDDDAAPTYATFNRLLEPRGHQAGDAVGEQIDREGNVSSDDALAERYGVTIDAVISQSGLGIAGPFWEFMNADGLTWQDGEFQFDDLFEDPFIATGLPISDPFWTTVLVGGEETEILVQVFERRVLTYNPENPRRWQVEMSNSGRHYLEWRYGDLGYVAEVADDPLVAWDLPDVPPLPMRHAECYEPRPSDDEHDLILLPAEPRSIFQRCQIIAYYGFPGEPRMGIVGEYEPEEMIGLLRDQTAEFENYNGFRTAIPALELIYAVAQGSETADGTYLARMPNSTVERWIEIAEEHDLILIFDIQMGTSTVEAEIEFLRPYLSHPLVHLALDPEFVTTPGTPPGLRIGGMEAAEINRAQYILKEIVDEYDLPNKILMIHQFIPEMILNKDQLENVPGIDLVIHQDGFGTPEAKIANYNRYIAAEGAKHGGFKIFYRQDEPVLTPAELMELVPQPDVVTYQ